MRNCKFYFYCRQIVNDLPMDVDLLKIEIKYSHDEGVTYSPWELADLTMPKDGLYMFTAPINTKLIFGITYNLVLHAPPFDKYQGQSAAFHSPIVEGCYDLNDWIQDRWVKEFGFDPSINWPATTLGYDFLWNCYSKTPNEFKYYDWVGTNVDPYEGF